MEAASASIWGTWEELVLGAAVLRHGTAAWDAVADELRARTHFPAFYTHQVCEVKYEEIRERYSGSDWFEELRRERIAQLRRELEEAGVCVESLLSKSESRNSESSDYNTSRTESPVHIEKAEGLDSSSKEACRDESSAGSYMGDTSTNWLHENRVSPSASSEENDRKEDLNDCSRNASTCRAFDITQGIARKKRGQRKRKFSTIVKEESAEESSMMTVDGVPPPQEEMTLPCKSTREANESCKHSSLILTGIMDSMMKHEGVSIFARRLETQKRARYKKMIRQHVDLRNVRLRIGDGSISTAKELFRDLLLIASNAIVFYPKSSPEHKSGIVLRGAVTQALHDHLCSSVCDDGSATVPAPAEVKSETIEPQACSGGSEDVKKKGAESLSRKRVIGSRAVRGKRGLENSEKERKRARRR